MTSYFEIDGEIISCDTIGDPLDVSAMPQSSLDASMRLHEREQIAAELTGDPNSLYYEDADLADVLNEPAAGEDIDQYEKWGRRTLGSALVRVGAIGLMVPDPIPLVDEIIFAGMIGVGVAIHSTTW